MQYRSFPAKEEKYSILGFGCMRLPLIDGKMNQIDEEKASAMIRHAIEEGVNYIDTAYPYHGEGMTGPGESEPFLGRLLKDGLREKVYLATKLPSWMVKSPEDMDGFLDEQLKRLQTDHIDLYLVHSLGARSWKKMKELGVTDFLDRAKAAGKIKQAGFSFHDDSVQVFRDIVDAYQWDFCQIQYNYMDTDYQAGTAGLEYALAKGLGIVIMEPLKGGSLAGKLPEEAERILAETAPGRSHAAWALRWLWNQEGVHVVLSGMTTLDQVTDNIATAKEAKAGELTKAETEALDKVIDILENKVAVNCTTCGYCMPCPEGVDIPRNFSYYNTYHRFELEATRLNTKAIYQSVLRPEEKAGNCVSCGQCEEHCPQNLPIIEHLKSVNAIFSP